MYEFEGVSVDLDRGEVVQAGERLDLQPLVLRALLLLVRHSGELLTRERLTEALWPDTFVNDEALSKVISRLRRTVRGAPIVTVPGRGYRLDAVVRWIAPDPVQPPPDRLFGRAGLLESVERGLSEGARLVTLVGPAGVGKTRVALEWSARVAGVLTLQCAPLRHPEQVAVGVLRMLGAARGPDHDAVDEAAEHLRRLGATRLLLDNLEHLDRRAAELVDRWLTRCPRLQVVATSRTLLGVAGELPLAVPPLEPQEALALLADRSGREPEEPGMDALGMALDGLPLAIELAASRLRLLEPGELAERVREHLDLIGEVRPRVDRPAHHASLQVAIQHSWDALTAAEQTTMARLTSWVGPFDAKAAERVLHGVPTPLDQLQRLVDASLVHRRGDGTLELLSTLRAFVRHVGEPAALQQGEVLHGQYIAGVGARLMGGGPSVSDADLNAVAGLLDEALVALDRALERQDAEVAFGALLAGYPERVLRSGLEPLCEHLEAVERLVSGAQRTDLKVRRAHVHHRLGHNHVACDILQSAVDEARERGDVHQQLRLELRQAISGYNLGDPQQRLLVAERALAHLPETDEIAHCGAHRLRSLMLFKQGAPRDLVQDALDRYAAYVARTEDLSERYDLCNTRAQIVGTWGEDTAAVRDSAECERIALLLRDPYTIWLARYNHGSSLLVHGLVDAALAIGQRGESEEVRRYPHLQAGLRSIAARALQYLGRSAEAAPLMRLALAQMREVGNPLFVPVLLLDAAEVAWMAGRETDAVHYTNEASTMLGPEHHPYYRTLLTHRIKAALVAKRAAEAACIIEELRAYIDTPGWSAFERALTARIAVLEGRHDDANRALSEAVESLAQSDRSPQSSTCWEVRDAAARVARVVPMKRRASG